MSRPTAPSGGGSAELLGDLDAAQRSLASQLDELRRADAQHMHGDVVALGGAKLLQLRNLRDQLVSGAKDMPAHVLRAAVASAIAEIRAYTSDARNATIMAQGGSTETQSMTLAAASAEARTATGDFVDDYYKHHIFDPYLKFASAQDEEEFRRREAERQRVIEKARAERTPEGDLRANQIAIDQLKDAGAHGATRSPEYQRDLNQLQNTDNRLSAAIAGAGPKSQPASTDPLDAASPTAVIPPELIAGLKASGVSGHNPSGDGHGLSVTIQQATARHP